jgi:hypothetical protein
MYQIKVVPLINNNCWTKSHLFKQIVPKKAFIVIKAIKVIKISKIKIKKVATLTFNLITPITLVSSK